MKQLHRRVWGVSTLTLVALAMLSGCGDGPAPAAAPAQKADVEFLADHAVWQQQRRDELQALDGWTSLVGLHWLELKAHYIGSGPGSGIRLEVGPPKLGMVRQQGDAVVFTPERGVPLTIDGKPVKGPVRMRSDTDGAPTIIRFDDGKGSLSVIHRGERFALRLKHADAITRSGFRGIETWPADPDWRIDATWRPNPPGKTLKIVDITGLEQQQSNPGAVEFQRDGKTFRIEALGEPDKSLFLVFADRTSGHGSYPAGRFIDTGPVQGDHVVVDFNRAYNPPCAFTPYATCPLPPPENRIDLPVTAGEKHYVGPSPLDKGAH
jgi:uncharacterized protein (DUF1684 family)